MARRPLIAGNWKMHKTHLEAIALTQKVAWSLEPEVTDAIEVAVCPPFTALRAVQTVIEGDKMPLALGAQNCHTEEQGAYTGEISAPMLAALNVRYAIVGHSERRQYFGETDELVAAKGAAAAKAGMTPLVCVGELLEDREAGRTADVVTQQVRGSLAGLLGNGLETVIAYEPVWAIGTGRTATPDDAQETCGLVRKLVAELAGDAVAERTRVLYGGSVKAANTFDLMAQPDVDGGLVGGASINAEEFSGIVKAAAKQAGVKV
jgi:triosephosphate isomerase